VAKALLTHVRGADLVARYGGEEFAVVFPETGKKAALGVAQKLRREIQGVRLEEYPGVRITASVGVASFPEDAPEPSALLARADQALYRSKEAGKNQVTAA
jgi:diguanylate cyclase (GGDEF)-like protein